MRKVIVEDYNIEWAEEFNKLKQIYLTHLEHLVVAIEHVGSTAVPGLAAKPILDIDIIIDDESKKEQIINILKEIGYTHQGDLGIKGREAFKRNDEKVPYDQIMDLKLDHHLYLCVLGTISLENHIKFRDFLRNNEAAVIEYSALKKELAKKYEYDINRYVEEKTPFITKMLALAGISQRDIEDITLQNTL